MRISAETVDRVRAAQQPAKLLVEAAAQASMLIVGRRNRRSRLGTHIGTVAHSVMHHARTPVAVVPHD